MKTLSVTLNERYVKSVGNVFLGAHSECQNQKVQPLVSELRNEIFTSSVIDEFQYGWRDRFTIQIEEETAALFANGCSEMFLEGDISKSQATDLLLPIQIPALVEYRQDHIQELASNSPRKIRERHIEYVAPIKDAVDGVLDTEEIFSLLLDGFLDSVSPLRNNCYTDSEDTTRHLRRVIRRHPEVDETHNFFYQGPAHLGILEHYVENGIVGCIYEEGWCNGKDKDGKDEGRYLFPVTPYKDDPVNYPILENILNPVLDSDS